MNLPQKIAKIESGESVTMSHAELDEWMATENGVPDNVVSCYLKNSPDFLAGKIGNKEIQAWRKENGLED